MFLESVSVLTHIVGKDIETVLERKIWTGVKGVKITRMETGRHCDA